MENGRRSHRKSRKGCVPCKKRKIKCGEERPQCSNCLRHKAQCLYLSSSSSPSIGAASDSPTPLHSNTLPLAKSRDGDHLVGGISPWNLQFTMIEMELLHNYCNFTCYTFDRNPAIQTIWRVNVPQLAFSNSYVMDAILCISALHFSRSRPAMRGQYVDLALQHHERGLAQVNALLPAVTEDNCTALYTFSAMTGIISFAKPRRPDDFLLLGQAGIADWLMLFRGTKHVIVTYSETLCQSELGPMLIIGLRRRDVWAQGVNYQHDALAMLMRYIEDVVHDEKTLAIHTTAVQELRQTYYLIANRPLHTSDCADVFIWFFEVSEEYLSLLYAKSQEAMAIFAFYCVVLKELEWSWFVDGWSTHIISVIHRNLDVEHRLWIQWALEQVGWNPS